MLNHDETIRLLGIMSKHDVCDELWWKAIDEERKTLQFFINCNDIFYWACADCEEITNSSDIDLLERSMEDCDRFDDDNGSILYCARKRQVRPQGAFYKYIEKNAHVVFNACGSERDIDFANPKSQSDEYLFNAKDKEI